MAMLQFFHGRRLRYQILARADGRWQIVDIIHDARDDLGRAFDWLDFEALETQVRARARAHLAVAGRESVRVVRERIRADGLSLEEPILTLEAPVTKKVERLVKPYDGDMPLCADADDLLHRPALRALGNLLRPLLDQLNATPVELVTLKAVSPRLQRAEQALHEAVARAARLQAGGSAAGQRARIDALEAIVQTAIRRVRQAEAVREPPRLGEAGLDPFLAEVARRVPAGDHRFWALRGIAVRLDASGAQMVKLEACLALAGPGVSDAAIDLVDEVVAAILDHVDVLREMLGRQPDLKAALLDMASLAEGKAPAVAGPPEIVGPLTGLIRTGRLPKASEALWDRIQRTLRGTGRLTRGSTDQEWASLTALERDLLPRVPAALRGGFEGDLARRRERLRQQILDEM